MSANPVSSSTNLSSFISDPTSLSKMSNSELIKCISQLKEEISSRQRELDQFRSNNLWTAENAKQLDLNTLISTFFNMIDLPKEEISSLGSSFCKQGIQKRELQDHLFQLQFSLSHFQTKESRLIQIQEDYAQEIKKCEQALEALRKDLEDTTIQINTISEQINISNQKIKSKAKNRGNLKQTVQKKQTERQPLNEKSHKNKIEISKLETQLNQLVLQSNLNQKNIQSCRSSISSILKKIQDQQTLLIEVFGQQQKIEEAFVKNLSGTKKDKELMALQEQLTALEEEASKRKLQI